MSEKKRTWNEKWKLVLNELEEKIGTEGTELERNGRLHGERTERERIRKQKNRRKYETKAEWKKAAFRQEVILHIVMSAAFADYHCAYSGRCQGASGVYDSQQHSKRKRTSHLLCGNG